MKARSIQYMKQRRAVDPEYDARLREQWKKNAQKTLEDPEKLEKRKEYWRAYHRRKREEKKQAESATSHDTD